ncbi:MAG: SPOR domain-containing protein [Thiothrix sp.]|nr:MAG: SPOR domain-containing protein [Thiothrix sp.]
MPIADPNTSAQAGSATGSAAATGTGVVAAAGSAVAGAVESGKQAIQGMTSQMQPDTTGFQVRDPKQGEVREVVENGQKQPGVGNMGANATTSSPDNTKAAATSDADSAASTSKTATAASSTGSGNEAKTVSANKSSSTGGNASAKDSPVVNSGELKPENPRLVNERPVPAPSAQPRNTASTRPATTTTSTTTTVERRVPTKPTEKPVVTTADASASGYVIQVLATSDKAKADSIRTSMTSEGYPVFVTNAKVDGKTVYRVRVGTYPGKGDAAAVQARMKARYTQNQYVQNSFVTKN